MLLVQNGYMYVYLSFTFVIYFILFVYLLSLNVPASKALCQKSIDCEYLYIILW